MEHVEKDEKDEKEEEMTTRLGKQFRNTVTQNLSFWISGGTRNNLLTMEGMELGNPEVFLVSKDSQADWIVDNFYIYCVYRKAVDFHHYLNGRDSDTRSANVKIWKQVRERSIGYNRLPILFMGQLNRIAFVCLNSSSEEALTANLIKPIATFWGIDLHLFHFSDLLHVKYKQVRKAYKQRQRIRNV